MKQRNMTAALLGLSALSMHGSASDPMVIRPPYTDTATTYKTPRRKRASLIGNTPPKNQRQRRKNARRLWAAGDKFAFSN